MQGPSIQSGEENVLEIDVPEVSLANSSKGRMSVKNLEINQGLEESNCLPSQQMVSVGPWVAGSKPE